MSETTESRQAADKEYATYVKKAYQSLTLWCQSERKIPTGFETFSTGVEAGIAWQRRSPTRSAALDALVAWRKADIAWVDVGGLNRGTEYWDRCDAESKLRVVADHLIAEWAKAVTL